MLYMHKTFTQNHLVTLLLGDLPPAEKSAHLDVVHHDWKLQESYKDLKKGHLSLTKIVMRPSQKTIDNILRYSQTSVVEA